MGEKARFSKLHSACLDMSFEKQNVSEMPIDSFGTSTKVFQIFSNHSSEELSKFHYTSPQERFEEKFFISEENFSPHAGIYKETF